MGLHYLQKRPWWKGNNEAIRCADIPRLPGLEALCIRAGLQGSDRTVRWPYCAETDCIAPWVAGGELVFITGVSRRRTESNLLNLVREAKAHDVAGLVILTGPRYIKQIPASVLTLANQLHLPVFEQPYSLRLVQVTEIISNAIIQDNLNGESAKRLFSRLINGYPCSPELIHLRAAELGLDHRPYCALVLSQVSRHSALEDNPAAQHDALLSQSIALEHHLSRLLCHRDLEWPVLLVDQDLITIWPISQGGVSELEAELKALLSRLQTQALSATLFAGVSNTHDTLTSLPSAVEQAHQAARFAVQAASEPLFFYDQLGIAKLFAAIPQRQMLADFCRDQLGTLFFAQDVQASGLKETLRIYLNHPGNQQFAAETLGIHRNTLRYRLTRIEALTGQSLSDAFVRLNLQNALLIEQMLFHAHDIGATPLNTQRPGEN